MLSSESSFPRSACRTSLPASIWAPAKGFDYAGSANQCAVNTADGAELSGGAGGVGLTAGQGGLLRGLAWLVLGLLVFWLAGSAGVQAQSIGGGLQPVNLSLGIERGGEPQDVDLGIQILFIITLLTLAPSIMLLMTSFTRIVIVLSFIRTALSLQGAPSNQIIVGLAFFISLFIMAPTWMSIQREAIQPYSEKTITSKDALARASMEIKGFMLKQTRPQDLELFAGMAGQTSTAVAQLPLNVVIPAFVISELRTAFQMGFLLFIPFIMIDLIVATVLMSMGMMMMPPVTVSLPLKILLFVLVDGWSLVVRSLVESFTG